ncbi:MAG: hypothetical protein K2L00_02430 [Muribaculaceae bacterium]|nr:hypothetical protein [Muribaculaceae bacterium]
MDYKNPLNVNQQGEEVADGTQVYRSGEVTYLVHLGYVGDGNEADKAKDFNCFRNVDYTYNLTVNGLNDIRVDAHATNLNPETYHGEEGLVVDLANATIDIDAHYAVFNIQLTQQELSGDFGFIITTYENGNQITVTDANTQRGVGGSIEILDRDETTVIDPKYYNWIELRPTTGQNVLAEYKPRYQPNSDGKTFLLTDLKAPVDGNTWDTMSEDMKSTSGWYTVYVNEYTYEPMYTGTDGYADEQWNGAGGRPNWMGYVNQNPRRFYIRVTQSTSPDGNSLYARSKYGISQQSLMSYYSDQAFAPADGDIPAGTAIGVERVNETEGMNLRHTFDGGTSTANGRWNTAQYLNGSATATTNLSINRANANQRPQWSGYINYDAPLQVPAVTGIRTQGGPDIPAHTIANGNPHKIPGLVLETGGASYTFSDPQASNNYTIQAINSCMSRNRDNNGNGRIEPDELRWYVPAMDQYLAMMLGEGSLPEPLMPYRKVTQLPFYNNGQWDATTGVIKNDYYSRYMAVSSNNDRSVMWLMEGTSTSEYGRMNEWSGGNSFPWKVRCIRNLGANMTTVTEEDKVSKPYVHDSANRRFRMNYYDLASIRTVAYTGNGTTGGALMPIHTIASPYNSVYYGFEYAATDITIAAANRPTTTSDADFTNTYDRLATYINGNPCGNAGLNGTGWRLPNQEEVTIMRNAGLLTNTNSGALWISSTVNYFSSTTGQGSVTDTANRLYLVVTPGQGTQLTRANLNAAGNNVFIRCVRDVNN